jgi:hypothetical protein
LASSDPTQAGSRPKLPADRVDAGVRALVLRQREIQPPILGAPPGTYSTVFNAFIAAVSVCLHFQ